MKAACLLTDSIYSLIVSDNGGTGAENEILGLGFAGVGEMVSGDGTTGAGSAGRGGVSEVSIGIGSWASRVGAGSGTSVGASYCGLSTSDVLASDPGAGLSPDSADSWLVLRVVEIWRFCNTSVDGRSGNSDRSGTFSNRTGLPWKKRFRLLKRTLISAKMVSILAE